MGRWRQSLPENTTTRLGRKIFWVQFGAIFVVQLTKLIHNGLVFVVQVFIELHPT